MSLFRTAWGCALILVLAAGCRSEPGERSAAVEPQSRTLPSADANAGRASAGETTIIPAGLESSAAHELPENRESSQANLGQTADGIDGGDPLVGSPTLSLDSLVTAVTERNPSLQSMVAAWQAASQRYPQAVALDDPMFQTMTAPASFDSSNVQPAYVLRLSQKLPWRGKRELRGQEAKAEADAAYHDFEDARVRLMETTRLAYYDYYLASRDLELNAANAEIMRGFRTSALARYQANKVTQQDVLQADVELADLERRRIELERMTRISIARINTLLRRPPQAELPPVPPQLPPPTALPRPEILEQEAFEHRPDLAALQSRIEEENAAVQLALKQYYPDVELFGGYDSFWQPSTMRDLRSQIGMNLNIPLYRGKLSAAVNEAMFRLSQRRAEMEQRKLDIQYEVQSAYERLEESRRTMQLYAQRFLPAAEQNVAASRANYDTGSTTFLGLAQSQRQLIELREKQQDAIAAYHRRLAEMERVLGAPLPR